MTTVNAYFSHEENVSYYRTLPNHQLICIVDDCWYTAIDDRTWEEPHMPIPDQYTINIVPKPKQE
jgi:hypothetical protein